MRPRHRLTRRQFVCLTAAAAAATQACRAFGLRSEAPGAPSAVPPDPTSPPAPTAAPTPQPTATPPSMIGRVALVKTDDRAYGVRRALDLLELNPTQGKRVLVKPNYNTADPAPASTHPEGLRAFSQWLWDSGAETIMVGDRAGMGATRAVMDLAGAFQVASDLGLATGGFGALDP